MKKGFTLIELLAVILIIALIAVIAVPNTFKVSTDVKKDMYCEKVDLLTSTTTRWADDHKSTLKETCYCEYSIERLVTTGKLKNEAGKGADTKFIENPYNSANMISEGSKVGVYKKNNRTYAFFLKGSSDVDPYSSDINCPNLTSIISSKCTSGCPTMN